jgi:hypothetical protein
LFLILFFPLLAQKMNDSLLFSVNAMFQKTDHEMSSGFLVDYCFLCVIKYVEMIYYMYFCVVLVAPFSFCLSRIVSLLCECALIHICVYQSASTYYYDSDLIKNVTQTWIIFLALTPPQPRLKWSSQVLDRMKRMHSSLY